mgnify:CR=1 FL=1
MLPKCRAIYIKFTVLLCLHPNTLFFIIELARYLVLPGVFRGFLVVFLSRSRFLPRLLSRSRSLSLPDCFRKPYMYTFTKGHKHVKSGIGRLTPRGQASKTLLPRAISKFVEDMVVIYNNFIRHIQ